MTVGDAVRTVAPGDLAVIVWHVSCGECDRCRHGLTGHCRQVPPGSVFGGLLGDRFDQLGVADLEDIHGRSLGVVGVLVHSCSTGVE
jgi:Zn-dependent alcohol dehydrogenase